MPGTRRDHTTNGVVLADNLGYALFAYGTSVPADGTAGYQKGCLYLDTDAAAGSILYCNEGTSASCDFDAVSVA